MAATVMVTSAERTVVSLMTTRRPAGQAGASITAATMTDVAVRTVMISSERAPSRKATAQATTTYASWRGSGSLEICAPAGLTTKTTTSPAAT